VLVSEVMLQQTQADRVVPYYRSFLERFPTPTVCAAAPAADVVRLWSGLGYNRRALNLHRAAQQIAAEFDGVLPMDERLLRTLPGIGPSTARAVLSFGFGVDVATVDTNVVRVLSRCVTGGPLSLPEAQALADHLLPSGQSWAFNQTMFDVGATLCVGTNPRCESCPLLGMCQWHKAGLVEPDPWRTSPSVRPQSKFAGSDRQGRGRLLDVLRFGPVPKDVLAESCGWPDDAVRSTKIAQALVSEGFAEWVGSRPVVLRLR
jgi:A/G-specific adenine glycosylase